MAAMAQAEVPTPPQPASPTKQEIWRVSLTVSHQTWTCATSLNSVKHISVKVAPQTEYIYIYTYMWLCVNTYCSGLSFLCIVSEFGFIYGSPSKLNIFVYMFTSRPRLPWGGSGCYEHELWREQPPQCPICASSRSSFINSDHSNTARGKGQSSQCSREVTWHMMADVFFEGEGMKMVKSPTGAHVMFEDSKGMSRWNLVNHSEIKVNSKSDSHDSIQIDTIYFPFVCKCTIFSSRYAMAASKPIESFTSSMPTPQFAAVARSFESLASLDPDDPMTWG